VPNTGFALISLEEGIIKNIIKKFALFQEDWSVLFAIFEESFVKIIKTATSS